MTETQSENLNPIRSYLLLFYQMKDMKIPAMQSDGINLTFIDIHRPVRRHCGRVGVEEFESRSFLGRLSDGLYDLCPRRNGKVGAYPTMWRIRKKNGVADFYLADGHFFRKNFSVKC